MVVMRSKLKQSHRFERPKHFSFVDSLDVFSKWFQNLAEITACRDQIVPFRKREQVEWINDILQEIDGRRGAHGNALLTTNGYSINRLLQPTWWRNSLLVIGYESCFQFEIRQKKSLGVNLDTNHHHDTFAFDDEIRWRYQINFFVVTKHAHMAKCDADRAFWMPKKDAWPANVGHGRERNDKIVHDKLPVSVITLNTSIGSVLCVMVFLARLNAKHLICQFAVTSHAFFDHPVKDDNRFWWANLLFCLLIKISKSVNDLRNSLLNAMMISWCSDVLAKVFFSISDKNCWYRIVQGLKSSQRDTLVRYLQTYCAQLPLSIIVCVCVWIANLNNLPSGHKCDRRGQIPKHTHTHTHIAIWSRNMCVCLNF